MLKHVVHSMHTYAQTVLVQGWKRRWVMQRGRCPAASTFPPRGGLSASLSPAWSFIIYRRDKIKQTQQNGVKSGSCGSHRYTLSRVERLAEMHTEQSFVQFLVPASQHPSASSSQVETFY